MCVFCVKQSTAYDMRISDWSSDVCSSDLRRLGAGVDHARLEAELAVAPLGGRLVHQSCTLRRLAEMMPELKPPQERSECRRPNSIFGQRSITTVSPAARARSAALWSIGRASCREMCQYV